MEAEAEADGEAGAGEAEAEADVVEVDAAAFLSSGSQSQKRRRLVKGGGRDETPAPPQPQSRAPASRASRSGGARSKAQPARDAGDVERAARARARRRQRRRSRPPARRSLASSRSRDEGVVRSDFSMPNFFRVEKAHDVRPPVFTTVQLGLRDGPSRSSSGLAFEVRRLCRAQCRNFIYQARQVSNKSPVRGQGQGGEGGSRCAFCFPRVAVPRSACSAHGKSGRVARGTDGITSTGRATERAASPRRLVSRARRLLGVEGRICRDAVASDDHPQLAPACRPKAAREGRGGRWRAKQRGKTAGQGARRRRCTHRHSRRRKLARCGWRCAAGAAVCCAWLAACRAVALCCAHASTLPRPRVLPRRAPASIPRRRAGGPSLTRLRSASCARRTRCVLVPSASDGATFGHPRRRRRANSAERRT